MADLSVSHPEENAGVKEALMNNDTAAFAAKIKEYLVKKDNIPLNIGITGETGAGKSTFVNAFRGISNDDEGAAPTGVTETTSVCTPYPHPNYPNVTLWDLPGIGSTKFPADKYLKLVGFEKFDFFIIISDTRFRENDVKLSQEIQKMKRKFYFVRSKIDNNVRAEQRKKDFSEEGSLSNIREDCVQSLHRQGFQSPQVFLVSSFDLQLYDFPLLHETFTGELPEYKRDALLFVNLEVINKKKMKFQSRIKYYALGSAATAGVPVPGLSVAVDVTLMLAVVRDYIVVFGLNKPSLDRLAAIAGVPYTDLCDVIKSPLAAEKKNNDRITKVLSRLAVRVTSLVAEEKCRNIQKCGIPAAMGLSYITTYSFLNLFLNELADDAQKVFERVLSDLIK